jgi:peptidoglycan/xylan/chitin deacetylase (PgdA/CDA1 family)
MALRRSHKLSLLLGAAVIAGLTLARGFISNMLWGSTAVHRVRTTEKVVALTYDDGPHPVYTPQILSILRKYRVKATFFMIGKNMDKYPEIVRRVVADGHAIGNHTYTHPSDINADSRAQAKGEMEACEKTIERLTGRRSYLFRPPKGFMDEIVYSAAKRMGYRTILWTVCADNHTAPTPRLMADRVLSQVRPGAIVLIHDGYLPIRWKDVRATPLIIEGLRREGYRFVTIPELLRFENGSGTNSRQ